MRDRRVDRALPRRTRGVWIATVAVLILGLVVLIWVFSPTERRRRGIVDRLAPGDPAERVVELLGEPRARCPGAEVQHLRSSIPGGYPPAILESLMLRLEGETRERWVFPLDPRAPADCMPRPDQTEIGVDARGRLIWLVALTGRTPLELPPNFLPAAGRTAFGP